MSSGRVIGIKLMYTICQIHQLYIIIVIMWWRVGKFEIGTRAGMGGEGGFSSGDVVRAYNSPTTL